MHTSRLLLSTYPVSLFGGKSPFFHPTGPHQSPNLPKIPFKFTNIAQLSFLKVKRGPTPLKIAYITSSVPCKPLWVVRQPSVTPWASIRALIGKKFHQSYQILYSCIFHRYRGNKTPKGIMRSTVPLPCFFNVVKSQRVAGKKP